MPKNQRTGLDFKSPLKDGCGFIPFSCSAYMIFNLLVSHHYQTLLSVDLLLLIFLQGFDKCNPMHVENKGRAFPTPTVAKKTKKLTLNIRNWSHPQTFS